MPRRLETSKETKKGKTKMTVKFITMNGPDRLGRPPVAARMRYASLAFKYAIAINRPVWYLTRL